MYRIIRKSENFEVETFNDLANAVAAVMLLEAMDINADEYIESDYNIKEI